MAVLGAVGPRCIIARQLLDENLLAALDPRRNVVPFGMEAHRYFPFLISLASLFRLDSFNWQAQITTTCQPSFSNCAVTFASRRILDANLSCQNAGLLAGVVVKRQSLWRCQKQPCTKTVVRYLDRK